MKIKTITVNGLVAALYIAITALVQPIAFNAVQFRVSEVFNHLVVFQKKYFFGIVLGVFFANLFFSPIKLFDLTFGVLHSALSLGITILLCRFIKNVRSEEHTSELQSRPHLVCRLLLEKKKT